MPNNLPPNSPPTNQEFSRLKQFLITQKPDGWERPDWVDEVNSVCGEDINERTRLEITADIKVWMKEFPKA